MLPSNNSAFHADRNHQRNSDEDFRRQQYQNRPHIHMQNTLQPNIEQERFEENRNHVQMHQNQIPPRSSFQTYYSNDSPYNHSLLRTGNDNGTSRPQYSRSFQNESALGQRRFVSNPASDGYSLQTSSEQLDISSLPSHAGSRNLAQVVFRPTDAPRRGRPPKNLSDNSSPKIQKSTIPKRRGRPPKDYTALLDNNNAESLIARGQKPKPVNKSNSLSDDHQPKRRGRPPKQPSPEREIEIPNPKFLTYDCEWKNCPAKLHNLVTLRMHLFKIHGERENGMSSCLWKGCFAAQTTEDEGKLSSESGTITHHKFKDENDWKTHVEEKHLTPYAWHMGDGPMNSLGMINNFFQIIAFYYGRRSQKPDRSVVPKYLFDKNGVQVIPSIENQQIEDGDPKKNNLKRFKRRLSGLDFVLDPIDNPRYESPIHNAEDDVQKDDRVHNEIEDEDDDDDSEMDVDSGF